MNLINKLIAIYEVLFKIKIIKGSKLNYLKIKTLSILMVHFPLLKKRIKKLILKDKNNWIIKIKTGLFYIKGNDDSFCNSSDYFEYSLQSWFTERKGNIFIDIGANIGFYTINVINKNIFKKAYCFEPNSDTFKKLNKNIKLNNLDKKVVIQEVALGENIGKLIFHKNNFHTGGSRVVNKKLKNSKQIVEVKKNTFDDFIITNYIEIKNINLIKIDVEGYEFNVIRGMNKFLNNSIKGTRIIIEIWDNNPNRNKTFNILKKYNYKIIKTSEDNYLFEKM